MITLFKNPQFGEVRVAELNNEPVFCLADLCKILDLTPKGVKQRLSDEVISNYPIIDSLGRNQGNRQRIAPANKIRHRKTHVRNQIHYYKRHG